jgi:ABC-type Fe3+/spermidine/putrescine transport system ATPase subunit
MSTLKVEYLRARVGTFEVTMPRLDVAPGQIVCLVGKSGSGKTTLLNAIAGFLPTSAGSVAFGSEDLTPLAPEKRRMAMVFQKGALFPHLTVSQNVEYGLAVQRVAKAERERQAREWLDKLEIGELGARYPHEISVGQAQRVGIARALAVRFPVLLLDEPFSALDPSTRASLRLKLRQLVTESKTCALLVSHFPEDLKEIADHAVCLSDGKVMWAGDPKGMNFDDPKLRQLLFGAPTG